MQQMWEVVAVLQVQGHRQEQEEEAELSVNVVRQQQRRERQGEQVELVQEACGDFTLMIPRELKCKYLF